MIAFDSSDKSNQAFPQGYEHSIKESHGASYPEISRKSLGIGTGTRTATRTGMATRTRTGMETGMWTGQGQEQGWGQGHQQGL